MHTEKCFNKRMKCGITEEVCTSNSHSNNLATVEQIENKKLISVGRDTTDRKFALAGIRTSESSSIKNGALMK